MLARVDMVLMGPAEPLKVPLTLGVEGGGEVWITADTGNHRRDSGRRSYSCGKSLARGKIKWKRLAIHASSVLIGFPGQLLAMSTLYLSV